MKIQTTKNELLAGVATAQRGVSTKNPIPVLSGIMMSAKRNSLELLATDLEIGVRCTIPVTVLQEGSCVLPAKYLGDIVRHLPENSPVILESEGLATVINYGKSNTKINGYNVLEYPAVPFTNEGEAYMVSDEQLRKLLEQVVYAVSDDDNRPVFTGVLLETLEGSLTAVATDTHRLALRKLAVPQAPEMKIIIPGRAVNEVIKLCGTGKEVKVSVKDSQIIFDFGDNVILSRLIEGQFPNYRQVLPAGYKTRVRVDSKTFTQSLERAALVANAGSNTVELIINGKEMNVVANTQAGQIHEELPVQTEGEAIKIGFNVTYLLKGIRKVGFGAEYIIMDFNGPLGPAILRQVVNGEIVEEYLSLVLPVRMA